MIDISMLSSTFREFDSFPFIDDQAIRRFKLFRFIQIHKESTSACLALPIP